MEERLNSWKAIAAYLGREVRTAQRWARDRGLPVHHLPGGARPRVFALESELDAWMRTSAGRRPDRVASVAVLPFLNLTGEDEDRFFGDGLADDLINELVRIPDLRVIARTSAFAFDSVGDDRVFEWLERSIEARDAVVTHLPSMPLYDGIREDPRFPPLLAKMGLG